MEPGHYDRKAVIQQNWELTYFQNKDFFHYSSFFEYKTVIFAP